MRVKRTSVLQRTWLVSLVLLCPPFLNTPSPSEAESPPADTCFSRMTQLPFRQGAINFPVYDSARKGISPIPKMPNNFLFFFSSVQILYLTPKRNKWFFTLLQKPKVLEGWQPPGGRALWLVTVNTSSICKQPRPSSLVTNDWLCDQRQQAPTGQTEWTHSSLVEGSMSRLRLLSSTAFCTTGRQDYHTTS